MAKAMSQVQALRALPDADLRGQLDQLRGDLWHHRVRLRAGAEPKTHLASLLRRQIARVLMVLNEHHQNMASSPQTTPAQTGNTR